MEAETKYEVLIQLINQAELEIALKKQNAEENVSTHALNEKGQQALETIVFLCHKEKKFEYCPVLFEAAAMLLLYLRECEAFMVLREMIKSSVQVFKDGEQKLIRWHLSFHRREFYKIIGTFLQSYIETTRLKKRSVLVKLNKTKVDINKLVDEFYTSFYHTFLPFPIVVDIFMRFLCEGTKVLLRYTYALLKVHKPFIHKLNCAPDLFIEEFRLRARTHTVPDELHQRAFKYALTRKHYNFDRATANEVTFKKKVLLDFLPADLHFESAIITVEQLAKLYEMMPEYVRIRAPELVYTT